MSFAESILWFLSTFVGCWGATLIVRGLRGEGIRKKWAKNEAEKKKIRFRPTWRLVGLGLGALAAGLGAGWYAGEVHKQLSQSGAGLPITPWQIGSAGVLVFGVTLLTRAAIGDRSRGRRRCPRCWYDMAGAVRMTGIEEPTGGTCPECGRAVSKERELLRARRSIAALASSSLITFLATLILVGLIRDHRPIGLIPDRVLVAWFMADGESPVWVRRELSHRMWKLDNQGLAGLILQRWTSSVIHGQSWESAPNDFNVVSAASFPWWPDVPIPPDDRLREAWALTCRSILDQLMESPEDERLDVINDTDRLFYIFGNLAQHNSRGPFGAHRTLPTFMSDFFGAPDLSGEEIETLVQFVSLESGVDSFVLRLLGTKAYGSYRSQYLSLASQTLSDAEIMNLSILLGTAADTSSLAQRDLETFICSAQSQDLKIGTLSYQTAYLFGRGLPRLPDAESRMLEIASAPFHSLRSQCIRTLLAASERHPEILDELLSWAIEYDDRAYSLLQGVTTFHENPEIIETVYEGLSESESPEVRLVVAAFSLQSIPITETIRNVLLRLTRDEDERVSSQALKHKRHLSD